jgi:hypothetical protein
LRKLFFIFITIAIVSGVIFNQQAKPDPSKQKSSIKVTYPKAGVTLNASTSCLIRWDIQGIQDIKAQIILLKAFGGKPVVIDEAASNNGKYFWIVPHDIQEGSYRIQVKAGTLESKGGIFAVKIPHFTLYDPGANDYATIGAATFIRWKHINAEGVIAQLFLEILNVKERKILAKKISADQGFFLWFVGNDINGNDMWDLTAFPDHPIKCRIGICLAGHFGVYQSYTKDFYVRK